jgi:5-deoxy-glucuronate isomerase
MACRMGLRVVDTVWRRSYRFVRREANPGGWEAVMGKARRLRFPPKDRGDVGAIQRVTATDAGWDLLNMEVRRLSSGAHWPHKTGQHEAVLVILGGRCSIRSNRGEWTEIGHRADVWSGLPTALYLPPNTSFVVEALTDGLEIAHCWVPSDQDHSAHLVQPEDCRVEIRGGNNATRQINDIIPPGFACHRIVACEVYTPGGNWSSYPPHKHDTHVEDSEGTVLEADLEEFYYYKIRSPGGYALQRVYTDDRRLDASVVAEDNDIVLVPEGYHPVSAAYGYDCYYLNFLAGSAQTLAATDDPAHAWTKQTWDEQDPRLPMVTLDGGR